MDDNPNWRPDRRSFLTTAGGLGLAATAGCSELLFGDAAEFEASPSRVPSAVLADTGYELDEHSEQVIERSFEVGDQSRDVVVTNKLAEYQKAVDLGPLGEGEAAIFTSLTTPQVEVLGQEFNPVEDMSTADLAEMIQDQYDEIGNLRREEEGDVIINGEATTQTKFRADGGFDGSPVDIFVHVSEAVEMGDDFVVTVGAYPELTPAEAENIIAMMEAVEPDS